MKITLRQLEIFTHIAELGTVTAAAEKIHLTQSAASAALQELEESLNGRLFDRKGKRLIINSHGQSVLVKAKNILDQTHSLTEDSLETTYRISIAASTTIGNYNLPSLLSQFNKRNKNVKFSVHITNTEAAIEKVRTLEVDFGLIEGHCVDRNIQRENWKQDNLIIISRENHPISKKEQIRFNDLLQYRWVCREHGSGTGDTFSRHIEHRYRIDIETVLPSTEAVKQYVRYSDCFACVSASTIDMTLQTGLKQLEVTDFTLYRQLSLITRKNKQQHDGAQQFMSFLNQT